MICKLLDKFFSFMNFIIFIIFNQSLQFLYNLQIYGTEKGSHLRPKRLPAFCDNFRWIKRKKKLTLCQNKKNSKKNYHYSTFYIMHLTSRLQFDNFLELFWVQHFLNEIRNRRTVSSIYGKKKKFPLK